MTDLNIHLEALREIKNWNIWLIGIAGAISTTSGVVSFNSKIENQHARDAKISLLFGAIAILCSISIIYSIPIAIDGIPGTGPFHVEDAIILFGLSIKTVSEISQFAVAISGLFLLSISWRTVFGRSFLDFGKPRRSAVAPEPIRTDPAVVPENDELAEAARVERLEEIVRTRQKEEALKSRREIAVMLELFVKGIENSPDHVVDEIIGYWVREFGEQISREKVISRSMEIMKIAQFIMNSAIYLEENEIPR